MPWALEQNIDEKKIGSNTFEIEWPKNSGKGKEYPEVDKAEWFEIEQTKIKY